jgi:kinesin family protein 20
MSANLFKDVPVPPPPEEKLQAYLRIRPVERPAAEKRPFTVSQNWLITAPPDRSKAFKNLKDGSSGCRQYTFNHIFDEDVGQECFYEKSALPLTVRLLRGESSLLFAYGTTNSGKSFTMRGTSSQPGVIPRALSTLFTCIGDRIEKVPAFRCLRFAEAEPLTNDEAESELYISKFICSSSKQKQPFLTSFRSLSISRDSTIELLEESSLNHPANSDMRFTVYVSFVEFYMDTINDLLAVEVESKKKEQLILIKDDSNNYFVKGLRRVAVCSADEAYCALMYGWDNLHRAETSLNKDSSRSHCIFTITLIGYEAGQYVRLRQVSNLSFCDLAGSERGDRTHNTGFRLKEAGKINNSLSTLGRCISALRHNQRKKNKMVVPFRDSSLTKYFQSYFNGTGVASMVININPSVEYFDETLVTLQFSAEASEVTVSTEEARLKLKESFTRLTQQWLQSSQRWSSFQKFKPDARLMSTMLCPENMTNFIEEEDEDAELTAEDLETLQNSILQTNDVETLNSLLQRIDQLSEKLKACENDKFNMEVEIRKEVNKEIRKMEMEHADERAEDRAARRELEQRFKQQIRDLKQQHRDEIQVKDKTISQLQQQLKVKCEEVTHVKADMEKQVSVAQHELHDQKAQTESLVQQLRALIENDSEELGDDAPDILKLVCTKIRDEQKALSAFRESNEKIIVTLQSEVDRLTAEAAAEAKRQQIQSASRCDQSCATSPVKVQDAGCCPRSPSPQDKHTTTDGLIQCQDHCIQTEVIRECQSVPVPKLPGVCLFKADTSASRELRVQQQQQPPHQHQQQKSVSLCRVTSGASGGDGDVDDDEADVSMEIGVTAKKRKLPDVYLQAMRKVSRC